ncbi:MAG TPA: type VI secretion system accessory protein TagJ [Steroidobacteraceae bacterium]|nr:type VI secretion system accessory protein TagJ [Steroidobacteraceae bacterium]
MSAAELFKAGRLADCLGELQGEVRRNPADAKLRVFLAQVLMVTGDWERALNQLSVVGEMDASAIPMVHAYRAAIQCETLRAEVFRGQRSPLVFGDPQPWIAQLVQALALQNGHASEAAAMRGQALEAAPATAGSLNGTAFEWIADADSRIGPILEVLLNGAYYWVPFARISKVTLEAPTDARDLVWMPAQFTWTNGGEAVGLIPVRYAGSEREADDGIRMSRKTDWEPIGEGAYAGRGQRVLSTSADELGLLEVRELELRAA